MRCLLAFWAGNHLKTYLLPFFERLEAFDFNCGEMNKQIPAAIVRRDEAKPLGVIEPFDNTISHFLLPSIS